MGAWGYGPFDNDDASDMVAALMKKVSPVIKAKTDDRARGYYAEARVSVQFLLLAHGTDILGGPGLDAAIDALARMRRDATWLSGAREPRLLARAVEAELVAVLVRMAACKGCREADGLDRAREVVAEARAAKVPVPVQQGRGSRKRRVTKLSARTRQRIAKRAAKMRREARN